MVRVTKVIDEAGKELTGNLYPITSSDSPTGLAGTSKFNILSAKSNHRFGRKRLKLYISGQIKPMGFIGRQRELEQLIKLKSLNTAEFVAIYGRRRVGKTYLVRHAFDNNFAFALTGLANSSLVQQLVNFSYSATKYAPSNHTFEIPANWQEAFQQLIVILEASDSARKIVFMDELPWLDTPNSGFVPALEHFWNSWASSRKDVVLIVCGSAAGWMISKLINNRGGLHNRVTRRMRVEPFTLKECEEFFSMKSAVYDRYQLILLYMVMGGIPFYLEQVNTGHSAAQNIERICFSKDGLLRTEFDNLYRSLFQHPEKHIQLIAALGKKGKGLTREELIKTSGLSGGGGLSRLLQELEESGFIRKYLSFGTKEKNHLYQLTDCYSLFYLKMIQGTTLMDENNWIAGIDSPKQRAWSGYAFEQVCLAHLPEIKKALGISGVQTQTAAWKSRNSESGAQIDLLIDRRDQVVNICEMKFSINLFTIDKRYAEQLRNKLQAFREESKTRKSLFLTLITTFGLTQNQYASSIVQNQLTMDALFESR